MVEKFLRKCLGLSVLRRFGGSTPSTSDVCSDVVVDVVVGGVAVGVGGVISNVGAKSFGIRKIFVVSCSTASSSSGSRIRQFTILKK